MQPESVPNEVSASAPDPRASTNGPVSGKKSKKAAPPPRKLNPSPVEMWLEAMDRVVLSAEGSKKTDAL